PFVGDTFMGILTQHMFEDIPNLEVVNPNVQCSEELALVIYKTMSKDADERYPDMPALGRAVADAMELEGAFGVDTMVGWGEAGNPLKRVSAAEAAATIEIEPTSGRAKLFAIAGIGLLLITGGIGAYLAFQPPSTAANGANTLAAVGNEPPVPENGTAPLAGAADAGEADADAAAEDPTAVEMMMVTIEVVTRPAGAEIMVGGDVVCDPSPCSFDAEVGQSIRIQARKGNFMATRDLEPGQAMAIEMQLARRPRRHDRNAEMTAGMRPAMMSGSHSDLKTPSIFQMSR
ncbi:MAG: hypothetical protein JRH11_12350, partial [Deltaproteobacteria bacterium]|nr:hypothetical protein [Deltaproteobacteria bacterium]